MPFSWEGMAGAAICDGSGGEEAAAGPPSISQRA
jgi:hypothetical protein